MIALLAAVGAVLLIPASASAAPTPSSSPSLAGAATQGQQLTLTPGGPWSAPAPATVTNVTDTWCTAASPPPAPPTSCTPLTGASSPYTLQASDVGQYIYVQETATASDSSTATDYSNVVGPVVGPPTNAGGSALPTIAGPPGVGQYLFVTHGTWANSPTSYVDTWYRCSPPAFTACTSTGVTTPYYQLVSGDIGDEIEVQEVASNQAGPSAAPAISLPTQPVVNVLVNSAPPTIGGTARVGQVLTEAHGTWSPTPASYAYQWYRCNSTGGACVPITLNGSSQSYAPVTADLGAELQVSETATNAGGPVTAYSSPTSPVADVVSLIPPPQLTANPSVGGGTQLGQTLLASNGSWTNNPTLTGQWQRCHGFSCTSISGATANSYTLTGSDVGSAVRFHVTASNSGGSAAADSNPSATITAPSTTSVTFSPSKVTSDQPVTLIATVTSPTSQQLPSGAITLLADGHAIPGCSLLPVSPSFQSVTVTCQTWFAASSSLSATFAASKGSYVNSSSSAASQINVGRATSSADLSVPQSVPAGSRVSYKLNVTVPGAASGTPAPAGSADFFDGGKRITGCTKMTLSQGSATCHQTLSHSSVHQITASYDGSGNLLASKSGSEVVTVGAPRGFVTAYLAWTFGFTPRYTRVLGLQASQLLSGSTITLLCSGRGCPFKRHDTPVRARCTTVHHHRRCSSPAAINLTSPLHGRHLSVGATLTVDITHPGWLGKFYKFVVRSRTKPQTTVGCLDVSSLRSGSCSA